MLSTVLIILLILFLIGGFFPPLAGPGPGSPGVPLYHGYGYGPYAGGVLGTILILLIVLALLGML